MKQALILIDIQNDYFDNGNMELVGSDAAATNAGRLLNHFREQSLPLFHVQHIAAHEGATFFLPETQGVEINSAVCPVGDESVIQKNFPNSFLKTDLHERLQNEGIDHLIITGMMTHMCVDSSTRAAAELGYSCTVAHDACATRTLEFDGSTVQAADVQSAFLSALSMFFAKITSTEDILASLK